VSIGGLIRSEEEKQVYIATQGKQIKFFNTNEEVNGLLKVVTTWRLYLGIREDASKEELILITNFIRENYSTLTAKEVEAAYKLAITNKLNVDAEPYGKFSPIYVARILNAYGEFKTQSLSQIRIRQNQIEREQKEFKKQTPEEKIESVKNSIIWYANKLKTTQGYVGDYNKYCWNFLTKNKIISGDNINFREAKDEAEKLLNRNRMNIFAKVFEAMSFEERQKEEKNLMEMYGRFYILKQFFSKIKNIEDWIKGFQDEQFL
jgi:hypothetical protein